MNTKIILSAAILLMSHSAMAGLADQMQSEFEQQSSPANAAAGKDLWNKEFIHAKSGKSRSCTSCHGADLSQSGKHVKTGKVIKPMAVSVNRKRLTKRKKINKWFKRNCKWTLNRQCNAQEKADILAFLKTL